MSDVIEVFKSNSISSKLHERWYWRVRSSNGQLTAGGMEGYLTAWNAKRAATKRNPGLPVNRVSYP